MANDMTIDELARITQEQFASVQEQLASVDKRFDHLEAGQKQILEILVDAPSPKVTDQISHRVEDHEERLTVIERNLQPVA